VSKLIAEAAERVLPDDINADIVNPPGSPFSIETKEDRDAVVPMILSLLDRIGISSYGAVVMGCFDDLALEPLRERLDIPVIGTFEAGLMSARAHASRFSIVTTFEGALPGISGLLKQYGAAEQCSARAAGLGVAAAANSSETGLAKIRAAIEIAVSEDKAEAVLLGSGGLTGRASVLQKEFEVPVIDGVEAAIRIAGALLSQESHVDHASWLSI